MGKGGRKIRNISEMVKKKRRRKVMRKERGVMKE